MLSTIVAVSVGAWAGQAVTSLVNARKAAAAKRNADIAARKQAFEDKWNSVEDGYPVQIDGVWYTTV